MNNIYIIVIALFILVGCSQKEDAEEVILSTPKQTYLYSVKSYLTFYKSGKPDLSLGGQVEWEFTRYNPDGSIKSKDYRPGYNLDPYLNSVWSEDYVYENGKIKEKNEFKNFRYKYFYSYSNHRLTTIDVFADRSLVGRFQYEYESGTNPSKMQHWWYSYSEAPTVYEYTYNDQGLLVKEKIVNPNKSESIITYAYDAHHNRIKTTTYDPEKGVSEDTQLAVYAYDDKERVTQKAFLVKAPANYQKYIYHFNEKNNITAIDIFESTNGIDGIYEQKGQFSFVYAYQEF